ncbi:HAMP domain-containing histidine kinase [Mucilaginibacter sp. JRF]|uniref:sensor histidine kinase n=1 Tax=Mucilaginibacter sp. JRF TaxID=2780088 RepID=UPI00188109B9|nr:HAMP domain-containing sensor histidine kinase [Mucilaginibacter sp. JRF]MBE9584269.1 HAMP domain-containing histidine kinase [Mucilaginibacter sp. JRF]
MKTRKSKYGGLLNSILIIFLLFTFIVTAGSFLLRHRITVRLEKLGSQLEPASGQQSIADLLVDLDMAENEFQKASSDGRPENLEAYQLGLDTIFRRLNSIISHYWQKGDPALPESRARFENGLQQKIKLSGELSALRKNFDSLLRVTTYSGLRRRLKAAPSATIKKQIDTLVSTRQEANRTSLLRRLKDALRPVHSVKVLTVREHEQTKGGPTNIDSRKLLALLGVEYSRLSTSSQALTLANLDLLIDLRQLTKQLQIIDHQIYEYKRLATLKAYTAAVRDLNTFTGIALAAVLLFIILLIFYIRRAGFAERRLRVESQRAIKLAGQKSEILAIMSHEIRNKLMAINGAVFMLKKTTLSPQQEQKVGAINLASGLVLETVNHVLDVSKLEQGYAESRKSGPFKLLEAIVDAVEAMRFMAENKGITLSLQPSGVDDRYVYGDSFRLKQILLNLLSNAIKYTEVGGVTLSVKLAFEHPGFRLEVAVSDTGVGIPNSLQKKLFTPYYQIPGGKPGTGLGLYLCRRLVQQEGGAIDLESSLGEGTTIRFHLPYESVAGNPNYAV